jgi:hypothetical protein
MSNDDFDDKTVKKFAIGFQRYAFGPEFVLESDTWPEAEEKIEKFLAAWKAHGDKPSPYYEANKTLWQEYQFLFLCQIVEFKLTELIERLRVAGTLKPEFLSTLQKKPKADPERAKDDRRIVSPASLLGDLGYTLGGLIKMIEDETIDFEHKDSLLAELKQFNEDRVKFIHLSFGGKESAGTDIADALQSGKGLLKRLEHFKVRDFVKSECVAIDDPRLKEK